MGGRHLCPLELLYTGDDRIDQRAKRAFLAHVPEYSDRSVTESASIEQDTSTTSASVFSVKVVIPSLHSPAAKLLAREQRQIAAHERCWYRANAELRRARRQAGQASAGDHRCTDRLAGCKPAFSRLLPSTKARSRREK